MALYPDPLNTVLVVLILNGSIMIMDKSNHLPSERMEKRSYGKHGSQMGLLYMMWMKENYTDSRAILKSSSNTKLHINYAHRHQQNDAIRV